MATVPEQAPLINHLKNVIMLYFDDRFPIGCSTFKILGNISCTFHKFLLNRTTANLSY